MEVEVNVKVEHLVQEAAEGALEGAGQPAGLAELDHHLGHGGAALHLLHHPPPTLHHPGLGGGHGGQGSLHCVRNAWGQVTSGGRRAGTR